MSGMTPYYFYDAFVSADYSDWESEKDSIRKAFHVAISASHLADHYCRYYQRKNAKFRQRYGEDATEDKGLRKFQVRLRRKQPSFKIIQDMANAYKHLYTRGSCDVSSSGAIEYVKYGSKIIDHDYPLGIIVIKHRNGTVTKFEAAISDVMTMWHEIIFTHEDPLTI